MLGLFEVSTCGLNLGYYSKVYNLETGYFIAGITKLTLYPVSRIVWGSLFTYWMWIDEDYARHPMVLYYTIFAMAAFILLSTVYTGIIFKSWHYDIFARGVLLRNSCRMQFIGKFKINLILFCTGFAEKISSVIRSAPNLFLKFNAVCEIFTWHD